MTKNEVIEMMAWGIFERIEMGWPMIPDKEELYAYRYYGLLDKNATLEKDKKEKN